MQVMSIKPDRAPARVGPHIAQLVVCYRTSIIDVVHVRGLRDRYSVGESPAASFKLNGAPLPDPDATTLVERVGERYLLTVPACFAAHFELEGRPVAVALEQPVELIAGLRATLVYGELRFDVSLVDPEVVLARRARLDRPFWASVAGIASLAVLAALLVRATPADGMSLALDDAAAAARLASYFEPTQPRELETDQPASADASSSPTPPASENEQTKRNERRQARPDQVSSSPGVPRLQGPRRAASGPQRDYDPNVEAQRAGILGILAGQDRSFLAASESAFGSSEADTRLWASASGLSGYGVGGLELTGAGRSVGGTASGVVGLVVPGLLGYGSGSGDSLGTTTGTGPRYPGRQRKVPTATLRELDSHGAMGKDVIRRIVRGHLNEVRSCYNTGLTRNPNLEGRVTVQFSILHSGKVGSAVIQANSTDDAELGACIKQAVKRWSFPAPPGAGSTLVSYPFALSSR